MAVIVTRSGNGAPLTNTQMDSNLTNLNAQLPVSGAVAAASGANTDITALAGLTTLITPAQGGTGTASLSGIHYGNGTAPITAATSTQLLSTIGTIPVASGGTGLATLTTNSLLVGNGTSALQAIAPGTSGNVLVSNGSTWNSQVFVSGVPGIGGVVFPGSTFFTIPAGVTMLKVTLVGGGGNAGAGNNNGGGKSAINYYGGHGGGGGAAIAYLTGLTPLGTLTIVVGAAGTSSSISSGTQTIATVTATGGGNGTAASTGGPGTNGSAGSGVAGSINFTATPVGVITGHSIFGGGVSTVTPSTSGATYGAGGSGGYASTASLGGAGYPGFVMIEY